MTQPAAIQLRQPGPPTPRWMRGLFALAALSMAGGAVFHFVRVLAPLPGDGSPPWRHGLFVVVDAALGIGFWKRPRWFPLVFAGVVAQQLGSHGMAAYRAFQHGHVDVVSLAVVALMPALLLLLMRERRLRRLSTARRP